MRWLIHCPTMIAFIFLLPLLHFHSSSSTSQRQNAFARDAPQGVSADQPTTFYRVDDEYNIQLQRECQNREFLPRDGGGGGERMNARRRLAHVYAKKWEEEEVAVSSSPLSPSSHLRGKR